MPKVSDRITESDRKPHALTNMGLAVQDADIPHPQSTAPYPTRSPQQMSGGFTEGRRLSWPNRKSSSGARRIFPGFDRGMGTMGTKVPQRGLGMDLRGGVWGTKPQKPSRRLVVKLMYK